MGEVIAPLVITCDRLFDGHQCVEGATVVVVGERVAEVRTNGAAGAVDFPDAHHIHAPFLMPGLIDSHVHLMGFSEGPPASNPFGLVENFMRLLICNGITSVRDAGNSIETVRYCERWGREVGGPRVFATGPLLDAPPLMWPFSRVVCDPEAACQEVHRLHAEGFEWVSLYHNVRLDVALAVIETAREHAMDVAADNNVIPAQTLLEAGVASLEHAYHVFGNGQTNGEKVTAAARMLAWSHIEATSEVVQKAIATLLKHGTAVCPTLLFTHRWCSIDAMVEEPNMEYMVAVMPYARNMLRMKQNAMGMMIGKRYLQQHLGIPRLSASERKQVNQGLTTLMHVVRTMHEAGVSLVVGSEAPSPSVVPGFSLHQEMALLVESGLPPLAVLQCATANAARLLRQEGNLGCIQPGAQADLLLIDGNPTENIHDTRNIQTVVKAGKRVDRKTMFATIRSSIESPR